MEEKSSSTTLTDISRYCSSFADVDLWPSSQSSSSRSPNQRFVNKTGSCSTDSNSPVLPSLPLPPSHWSLTSAFANLEVDSPLSSLWPSTSNLADKQTTCVCCHRRPADEFWNEKSEEDRPISRLTKEKSVSSTVQQPIQRPSASPRSTRTTKKFSIFDSFREENETRTTRHDNDANLFQKEEFNGEEIDDGTLRLHVSNIPFTWTKEKLAEVFGKYGITFDVEVVYNERGSKGFGFVTFLAKKDALEAKKKMDREIVDGRRLVVNFAKPKQKSNSSSKDHSGSTFNSFKSTLATWKSNNPNERSSRSSYQTLGFSTPPTARRQNLTGFSSLSSTPTRSTASNPSHRHYL